MQHDVQELNRVLVDKLEEKMKVRCSLVNFVSRHFRVPTKRGGVCPAGHERRGNDGASFPRKVHELRALRQRGHVVHVDEDFYDLQMPVKGCKDLYASLDEYVKEETLDGDNQYHSERYGKQDAKKGVAFKSLPPVLELHLRRFEYDFTTDAMAKVHREP